MNDRQYASPFPRDTNTSLTMAIHKGRVLSCLQQISWHFLQCSPVSFKADTLYTLWSSTKGLHRAAYLLIEHHGRRCNWHNRAASIFDRFNWNGSNSGQHMEDLMTRNIKNLLSSVVAV